MLGPPLFSIDIKDLPSCISSADVARDTFADDSSLTAAGKSVAAVKTELQTRRQEVSDWRSAYMMSLNPEETKSVVITTRQKHQRGVPPLDLWLKSPAIERVSGHRHLGVIVDDQLKWQAHIKCITNTVAKNVYLLSRLLHFSNVEVCRILSHARITSRINLVSNVWDSCSEVQIRKFKAVHQRTVQVLGAASQI